MSFLICCRYEKRQALKARFEIEQKLRRERKAKRTRIKDKKKDDKRLQLIREKRSKLQDKRSRAIDELKAKRSAGIILEDSSDIGNGHLTAVFIIPAPCR